MTTSVHILFRSPLRQVDPISIPCPVLGPCFCLPLFLIMVRWLLVPLVRVYTVVVVRL